MITFMWTPPHFWALALYKTGDYGRVGIPMMPNVAGAKSTRLQIFIYSLVLFAVCLVPLFTGLGGPLYAVAAIGLNIGFTAMVRLFNYLSLRDIRGFGRRRIAERSDLMKEYRSKPESFVEPSEAELRARNRRNIGIALALLGFMVFVFVTMVTRG